MPETINVRAFPTPEGWWWYDVLDEATGQWSGRMRRAETVDLLMARGHKATTATNRLRVARDAYDAWRQRQAEVADG